MSAPRNRLPDRRHCETMVLEVAGIEATVSIGRALEFDTNGVRQGPPLEVFIEDVGKHGSPLHHLLQDVAVIISVAVQSGVDPADLAKSVARVPAPVTMAEIDTPEMNCEPASFAGAILDLLSEDST